MEIRQSKTGNVTIRTNRAGLLVIYHALEERAETTPVMAVVRKNVADSVRKFISES